MDGPPRLPEADPCRMSEAAARPFPGTPSTACTCWSGSPTAGMSGRTTRTPFSPSPSTATRCATSARSGTARSVGCDFVFAVSDGMGGAKSGEFASRIAATRSPTCFRQGLPDVRRRHGSRASPTSSLELIARSTRPAQARLILRGMCGHGCHAEPGLVHPEWLYFGHLGDSRVYYLPAGRPEAGDARPQPCRLAAPHRAGSTNARPAPTRAAMPCSRPSAPDTSSSTPHRRRRAPARRSLPDLLRRPDRRPLGPRPWSSRSWPPRHEPCGAPLRLTCRP
jgi:hypothetical protein